MARDLVKLNALREQKIAERMIFKRRALELRCCLTDLSIEADGATRDILEIAALLPQPDAERLLKIERGLKAPQNSPGRRSKRGHSESPRIPDCIRKHMGVAPDKSRLN